MCLCCGAALCFYIANILLALDAVYLLGGGVYGTKNHKVNVGSFKFMDGHGSTVTYVLFALLIAISALGLLRILVKNKKMNILYGILLTVAVLYIVVFLGIIFKNLKHYSPTEMKKAIEKAIPNYGQKDQQNDTEFLDKLHNSKKCCGLKGPEDFKDHFAKNTTETKYFVSSGYPMSCLDDKKELMKTGCEEALKWVPFITKFLNISGLLAAALLLGIISIVFVCKIIK